MAETLIIAEAGVNHNGSLKNAYKLARIAKQSGADFVKFQFFVSTSLASKKSIKAKYQIKNLRNKNISQLKMLNKLQLDIDDLIKVEKYCNKIRINFLLSFFDHKSIRHVNKFNLKYIKIPSGEITNYPLLRNIAKTKKKIILSTGMANLKEISDALKVLFLYNTPRKRITILHCTTDYPALRKDVNLNSMLTIKEKFKCDVGYSDHTINFDASVYATVLGARIIEKHFTINKSMKGPDHKASLNPKELKKFVKKIRNVKEILGSKTKKIRVSEIKNIKHVRKSVYASREIKKDEILDDDNIMPKRPFNKNNPMNWNKIIGKKSKKNFKKDEEIKF